MGLQINTNVGALNAYRNLSGTQNAMSTSLERLSSGLRINRAADDAAGLAISEKLRSQISGLQKASSNAQDGISLIQTGEGALNESHSILQRMRELSVQASNDTNTTQDRKQIQKEVDQLSQELSRIGNSTQFNGKSLLNGDLTATPLKLQIGANAGQNLTVSIGDMRGRALGVIGTSESTVATGATKGTVTGKTNPVSQSATGSLKLVVDGDTANPVTVSLASGDTSAQAVTKINTALGAKGTAAIDANGKLAITSATTGASSSIAVDASSTDATVQDLGLQTAAVAATSGKVVGGTGGLTTATAVTAGNFNISVDGAAAQTVTIGASKTVADVILGINTAIGAAGTASLDGAGKLQVVSASTGTASAVAFSAITGLGELGLGTATATAGAALVPKAANVTTANGAAAASTVATNVVTNGTGTNALDFGSYSIAAVNASNVADVLDSSGTKVATYNSSTGDIKDLASTPNTLATVASGSRPTGAWSLEIHGVDVSSQAAATAAISTVDTAIAKVSDQRSTLGSVQNRLQHTINNLGVAAENLTASESRIRDTDMAKEMTAFTRAQILSQAGISMLAQANQAPQSVLKLLG
ncbi:MAG: flagellin [Frankiales bacterium]|nr:flagellin [Frankiales bacterium]